MASLSGNSAVSQGNSLPERLTALAHFELSSQLLTGALFLQALAFAKEALEGFEESTGSSREAALDATRQAADYSQLAHKLMRAVYKGK